MEEAYPHHRARIDTGSVNRTKGLSEHRSASRYAIDVRNDPSVRRWSD